MVALFIRKLFYKAEGGQNNYIQRCECSLFNFGKSQRAKLFKVFL